MKTYHGIVFTDLHHTKLHPFQNLSLVFTLKVFLKFCTFQPEYCYKIYSYGKKRGGDGDEIFLTHEFFFFFQKPACLQEVFSSSQKLLFLGITACRIYFLVSVYPRHALSLSSNFAHVRFGVSR